MKCGMNTSFDVVIYMNRKLQEMDNSFSFVFIFPKTCFCSSDLVSTVLGQDLLQIKQAVYFFIKTLGQRVISCFDLIACNKGRFSSKTHANLPNPCGIRGTFQCDVSRIFSGPWSLSPRFSSPKRS